MELCGLAEVYLCDARFADSSFMFEASSRWSVF